MTVGIHDDLYAEDVIADPYAYYGRIREEDPVHWNERFQTWLVTRHDDIIWVLRHPELFSNRFYADDPQPPTPAIDEGDYDEYRFVAEFRSHEIIQNDPPTHTRLRSVLNRHFTPSRMERHREMVRNVVEGILDDLSGVDHFDIHEGIAQPLPIGIISELLGVPAADRIILKEQAARRMQSALGLSSDRMRVAASGIRDTSAYLENELDDHAGAGDLMEILSGAREVGTYSREETLANAQILIDAGHETTMQLVCNGMLSFLRNRRQWERLKEDPDGLARSAVDECLRYDPPLSAVRRLAAQDVELRGKQIRRGQRVLFVIAAGNRDPRVFEDPDEFDIGRDPNPHIAFGSGVHFCLGQYLARIEGQEVFTALARRAPDLELATDHTEHAKIRGPRSLVSLPVVGLVR